MAAAPAIELEVDYLVYKDSSGAEVVQSVREMAAPTGGIQAFAMPTAPDGWLICDGSNNLLIGDFPALYDALTMDIDCTVGSGSTVVTVNDAIGTTNLSIGMGVRGVGVPSGTTIVQINTTSTFTMSAAANANNTADLKMLIWGEGANISTFKIPDLRGEFLRGWDSSRGVDSSRMFASWQAYAIKNHGHSASIYAGTGSRAGMNNGWAYHQSGNSHFNLHNTGVSTGFSVTADNIADEVRPRNLAVQYCIKF